MNQEPLVKVKIEIVARQVEESATDVLEFLNFTCLDAFVITILIWFLNQHFENPKCNVIAYDMHEWDIVLASLFLLSA